MHLFKNFNGREEGVASVTDGAQNTRKGVPACCPKRLATLVLFAFALLPTSLLGFPTQDDETLGVQALHYRKQSNFWFRVDMGGTDGRTTTKPPGSTYLDRWVETFINAGGDI